MTLTRLKVALVAAFVCAVTPMASAGPAFADANDCTLGTSSGNTLSCFVIINSGLSVSDMTAQASIENSGRTLQVCVHGPDPALPKCTDFVFVPKGGILTENWSPNRNVVAGTYCGRTWRRNSDGSHTLIGEVCFDVHS